MVQSAGLALTVIILLPMTQTTPQLPTPHVLPTRRVWWIALIARILLWMTVAIWLVFGASWTVLHGWIVPRIGEFRPRLEQEASKALGIPVRIGRITAQSEGFMPSFELRDVVLYDQQGREALRLPRLLAALSPTSVWALGFEQLFIDQPVLDIRRASDGKIYVGGLDISQNRGDGNAAANWIFSQAELSVKGGTVRWTDELLQARPLALSQVDAVLRNSRRRHLMRLDATPPADWGERFSLRGIFRQPLLSRNAGQWRDWSGQVYAESARIDVSQARPYLSLDKLGADVRSGKGSVRAWADVSKGQISSGTFDVALTGVEAQLGRALEPLALESVAGRFGGRQLDNGFEFSSEGLNFKTRDGLRWPGGNLALTHTAADSRTSEQNQLTADKLDLATLALIANRLPLGTSTHALITSYAPKGLVETVEARWQVPASAPVTFSAKGRVTGLELASLPAVAVVRAVPARQEASVGTHERPGRPGVSGAAIDFDVTHTGGKASVRITHGSIDFPGVFEDPHIPFGQLSLDAQWKQADGKTDLQLRNVKFANMDAEGVAQVSWQSGDPATARPAAGSKGPVGSLGTLDLQGSLSRGDGAKVHRYLPLALAERVRHYVRDAVTQGEVSDVKFKVRGPVNEIPFSNPEHGDFKISAKVKNGVFAYVPKTIQPRDAMPWPVLNEVRGELVFNHAALEINGATARVAGLPGLELVKSDARIPDLLHGATLDLTAKVKGPLTDALGFVNTSPVGAMTGGVLGKAVGTGNADYSVHLNLPLFALDKTQVQGTVTLPGNDVQFTSSSPMLARLKGSVNFSETGFSVAGAQARVMGGDIRFEGGMRGASRPTAPGADLEPTVAFKAQGNITAEGLRQAKDLGFASRIAQNANGGAAYAATLAFRRGVAEVVVTSNLQGMALNLPAPLNKGADTALPMRFENTLVRESLAPGQKLQDQLVLTLGRILSVAYVRDVSGADARVIRGAIGVGLETGESAPLPETGVSANINIARIDIDAWEKALAGPVAAALPGAAPASPAGSRVIFPAAAQSYLPTQIAVRAKELQVDGRKLNNLVVGGSREGLNWRANIDATELNGYVEFRQPGGGPVGTGEGRVFARLSRLSLAPSTASDVENILDEQPANIPALDIVVDDLELRGKKLGRVEIDAVNRGASVAQRDGGAREWRLNKFNITVPEAVLTATGNWVATNAQAPAGGASAAARAARAVAERRRTVMNFKLDILDSGELLRRFGMKDVIRRGKGKIEGQVAWVGSPLSPDYPSMNGQFNVNIESGQFLKADPGIAKLLGVLSLQSLPRRLTLDFRDVFSQGFAFDFVRGDVNINQGVAATNNLQMKGVNAAVLMDGSADIARETQNLKVVVVPEINAGTASLIATVINPAVGLGTFLAQYFLRRPLIQATTQEFHIDGSWTDPRIAKVERKP